MPSQAMETYALLRADIETLVGLQTAPGEPERSTDASEPLLRAVVVLLVTAWENYVEQAVAEAFRHVMSVNAEPKSLSSHMQGVLSRAARDDVWSVTGENWRSVVEAEASSLIDRLNNAASGQVNELVSKVLGLPSFLAQVTWTAFPQPNVEGDLRSLVNEVRGEIVHKGRTPSALNVPGLAEWRNFVDKLVVATDRELATQVHGAWGSRPW